MAQYVISNINEFQECLKEFNTKFQKDFMRTAYADAVKPVIREAKANAHSKRVKQSIGAKYYPDSTGGYEIVGARVSKTYKGYLARWEEEGTQERIQKKTGRKTGKVTGTWFFNRAVTNTQGEVFGSICSSITNGLLKTVNKYNKKNLSIK